MDAIDCRKSHSGPYVVVYPYARGEGPNLASRNAAAAAAATNRQTEVTSRSTAEADPAKAAGRPAAGVSAAAVDAKLVRSEVAKNCDWRCLCD